MYKLIIIDDDNFSLQMLSTLINWEENGFFLMNSFSDSEEAFEYLKTNEVHLVFSDIKMPDKEGIDIARLCCSLKNSPIVVFISAYSDFEYARTALRYNVFDYVTKPFSISQIKEILQRAREQLDSSTLQRKPSPSLALKHQLFLYELLSGTTKNIAELLQKMDEAGIDRKYINSKTYILNIDLHNIKSYLTHIWKHGKERFFSAFSYLVSSTDQYFSCVISFSDEQAKAILVLDEDNSVIVPKYISELENNLLEILELKCKISIEKEYSALSDILNDKIVTKAKSAVEQAIVYMKDNFAKDITLEDVANHVFLNKVYFSSLFKSSTGENFTNYLNKIRIEKAIELLKKGDEKISSIALNVGYNSMPHFYKIFSEYTGYTPVKYKELLNEKPNS